jgi:hypothetical protein
LTVTGTVFFFVNTVCILPSVNYVIKFYGASESSGAYSIPYSSFLVMKQDQVKNLRIFNNIVFPMMKFSGRNMQYAVMYLGIVNAYN